MQLSSTVASPKPSDPLERDARELHRTLEDLQRVLQFRDRDRICCHDVSVSQCYALEAVVRRGPVTLNELAALLYLDKSTASRVVGGLVGKGYVTREPHPEDGRAVQLVATHRGRDLCDRIEDELVAEVRRTVEDFDPEVRRAMVRLLARLTRAALARVETSGGSCRLV